VKLPFGFIVRVKFLGCNRKTSKLWWRARTLNLPAAPLGRLARSARTSKPANLPALLEPQRSATLAALFQSLEAVALDDAVELFDALATDIFALPSSVAPSEATSAASFCRC